MNNETQMHIYCSHYMEATYDSHEQKIYLIDKSGAKMSVPFKTYADMGEFRQYAEGMIDMLLRMGGK